MEGLYREPNVVRVREVTIAQSFDVKDKFPRLLSSPSLRMIFRTGAFFVEDLSKRVRSCSRITKEHGIALAVGKYAVCITVWANQRRSIKVEDLVRVVKTEHRNHQKHKVKYQ